MKKTELPLTVGAVTVGAKNGCLVTADGKAVRVQYDGVSDTQEFCMTDDCSRATVANGVDVFRFRGGLAFFADEAALYVLSGESKLRIGGEETVATAGDVFVELNGKICLEAGVPTTVVRLVTEEL